MCTIIFYKNNKLIRLASIGRVMMKIYVSPNSTEMINKYIHRHLKNIYICRVDIYMYTHTRVTHEMLLWYRFAFRLKLNFSPRFKNVRLLAFC